MINVSSNDNVTSQAQQKWDTVWEAAPEKVRIEASSAEDL